MVFLYLHILLYFSSYIQILLFRYTYSLTLLSIFIPHVLSCCSSLPFFKLNRTKVVGFALFPLSQWIFSGCKPQFKIIFLTISISIFLGILLTHRIGLGSFSKTTNWSFLTLSSGQYFTTLLKQ